MSLRTFQFQTILNNPEILGAEWSDPQHAPVTVRRLAVGNSTNTGCLSEGLRSRSVRLSID